MKPETAFFKWIKTTLKNVYFCRIEHSTTAGIPDLFTVFNNKTIFIELKFTNTNRLEKPRLNKFQTAWHMKYLKAGGNAFILVNRQKQLSLELFKLGAGGLSHKLTQPKTRDGLKNIFKLMGNSNNL